MVRLREIPRTAAFAWSSGTTKPLVVTGTRAGAVDDSFSDEVKLELWDLNLDSQEQGLELQPIASIAVDSKCVPHVEPRAPLRTLTPPPQIPRHSLGTARRDAPSRHHCWRSGEWLTAAVGC